MKKILTVLAIVALVSSVCVGQMTITKGIKGGLNFATWGGSDKPTDVKSTTQFSGGLFFSVSLPFGLSAQPELLYTVKGYKAGTDPVTTTQTLQYIELPILVKYALPTFSIVKPNVFVGPSFAGRLGAKQALSDSVSSTTIDNKTSFSDKDIAIVFGAGAVINTGVIDVVFDIRYSMGVWKLDRPEKMKIFNRGISVMAGIVL
jgi:hypothetical protein